MRYDSTSKELRIESVVEDGIGLVYNYRARSSRFNLSIFPGRFTTRLEKAERIQEKGVAFPQSRGQDVGSRR